MKFSLMADGGGFTSWCLLPTILCGTWENAGESGGWCYIYWIKHRLGVKWKRPTE